MIKTNFPLPQKKKKDQESPFRQDFGGQAEVRSQKSEGKREKTSKKKVREKRPIKKQKTTDILPMFGMALNLGFDIVIPMIGGVFLGYFLDSRFESKPLLTVVFLTIGTILGLAAMVKKTIDDSKI